MKEFLSLSDTEPGKRTRVKKLAFIDSIHKRFPDIGLVESVEMKCLGQNPLGDPCACLVHGAVIAIRSEGCREILVQPCTGFDEQKIMRGCTSL